MQYDETLMFVRILIVAGIVEEVENKIKGKKHNIEARLRKAILVASPRSCST
jgi:hypothetical protein